eukprot:TRINITY_DN595_c0_g3_i9.p1 TRINITY_DN595_c0_g3~~TRINITY_DN595_c0_g3_i9.p1  ORF type:complete len:1168 (+),score=346.54 TRINITY_DN595_c0_g3_i9:34-3537(+)
MPSYLEEELVRSKVLRGLRCVERVLAQNRAVGFGSDVPHSYGDKYALAEFMVRGACGAALNSLQQLGLQREGLRELKEWSKERRVILSLWREEKCTFDRKTRREVEGASTVKAGVVAGLLKMKTKTVTTVEEHFWDVEGRWELRAFGGTDRQAKKRILREGKGAAKVKTLCEESPRPSRSVQDALDVDVSWLLEQVNGDLEVEFGIDRNAAGCYTPRRNTAVEGALSFFSELSRWCKSVRVYFEEDVFPVEPEHGLDLTLLQTTSERVFVPVLPILQVAKQVEQLRREEPLLREMEKKKTSSRSLALVSPPDAATVAAATATTTTATTTTEADDLTGRVLGWSDLEAFLEEEARSLQEWTGGVEKAFGGGEGGLVSKTEGVLVAVLRHVEEVAEWTETGLDFVEGMLMRQLVAALGREVTSEDFGRYMRFHNRKLFLEEVAPREFCYAVRRDGHDPEGVVAVEEGSVPVMTTARCLSLSGRRISTGRMRFALNAAAEVSFGGERFVHAYVRHRFSTEEAGRPLELVARARQFSGFVLAIGRIGGRDLFLPEHAILVRNKDELRVPLELEQIPTPKEFEDAVESLSPEQQRFAKAYRSMQMEATLFGVCVLQVKPQLERVLNLPQGALTKELRLTEDLLELFVDHNISSDLLSFQADFLDDEDEVPTAHKVEAVRGRVEAMKAVIQEAKDEILEEQRRIAELKRLVLEEEERKRVEEQRRKECHAAIVYDDATADLFEEIEWLLQEGKKLQDDRLEDHVSKLKKTLREAKRKLHSLKVEVRGLPVYAQPEYQEKVNLFQTKLTTMRRDTLDLAGEDICGAASTELTDLQRVAMHPSTLSATEESAMLMNINCCLSELPKKKRITPLLSVKRLLSTVSNKVQEPQEPLNPYAVESCEPVCMNACEDLSVQSKTFYKQAKKVKKKGFDLPEHSSTGGKNISDGAHLEAVESCGPVAVETVAEKTEQKNEEQHTEKMDAQDTAEAVETEAKDSEKTEQQEEEKHEEEGKREEGREIVYEEEGDISKLPEKLEEKYKEFDEDNCLRPTIIKTGKQWKRKGQKALLSPAEEQVLDGEGQKEERNKAFDLLDSLTRSGALPVEEASLHVVVAATHCFDLTLMDTVVQRSVNPVEKVERSTLIAASVVHDAHPSSLIKDNHLHRLATCSPKLMAQ